MQIRFLSPFERTRAASEDSGRLPGLWPILGTGSASGDWGRLWGRLRGLGPPLGPPLGTGAARGDWGRLRETGVASGDWAYLRRLGLPPGTRVASGDLDRLRGRTDVPPLGTER